MRLRLRDTPCVYDEAWDELLAAVPPGWFVGRPVFEERYGVGWSMYAFDTTERPKAGKRQREWTTIGPAEEQCIRNRTQTPEIATAGKQRARLMTRLEQLKKQHGWGDISDDAYRSERDATQAALARLPDGDRVVAFDAHRARILALPDAIAMASPQRREELCRIVVKRVVVADRRVVEIEWTAPAQPFLKDSGRTPKGAQAPSRCPMTIPWHGTWREDCDHTPDSHWIGDSSSDGADRRPR